MDMNIDYEANETIFHSRPILQAAHWGWGGGVLWEWETGKNGNGSPLFEHQPCDSRASN